MPPPSQPKWDLRIVGLGVLATAGRSRRKTVMFQIEKMHSRNSKKQTKNKQKIASTSFFNPFPTVAHLFIFIFCSCFLPPTQNICHFPRTNY
jgi:hypothetical protein